MKKSIIAILIFIVVILGTCLSIIFLKNEPPKYTLNYTADDFKIYSIKMYNNKVTVSGNRETNCVENCDKTAYTFKVGFSEDNLDKIFNLFNDLFKDGEKTKDLTAANVPKEDKLIISAMIKNDETKLNSPAQEIPKEDTKELLFTLKSIKIDCQTVLLTVYDDGTYELQEKLPFTSTPTTGKYTYDVTKIVANNDKYEPNDKGYFILTKSSGEEIKIYDSNKDLTDFLKEINVNLDTCISIK